ncbi:PH domain-containing protein [Diplocloster agilis]|uniref:PH domain-containing protein n=1 Tax=Diplocloster agilis TaxID=2850323 RepID=UPI000820CD01|nr:PH domain-containing protein [Suonthocola fibrivorans]MCU6735146.1 PH domain-containing protein [Suonthocola fibrivorans]SCJ65230.1 Protein of uncharacterised function (DUF1200) [uncultured Clostridium sp.]
MIKIKGKIAIWFWLLVIAANAITLYELLMDPDSLLVLAAVLIMINLIFLPILIRNRIEIRDDKLYLYFGFFKDSMEIASIKEVRKTHNPISSSAASLDRLLIRGPRQEMMIAVVDKELLIQELKKRNPYIVVFV